MNNSKMFLIAALAAFLTAVCSGSADGGKSFSSAEELKEYLGKQPADSPGKLIKIAMKAD
jgi:hypothetical protein